MGDDPDSADFAVAQDADQHADGPVVPVRRGDIHDHRHRLASLARAVHDGRVAVRERRGIADLNDILAWVIVVAARRQHLLEPLLQHALLLNLDSFAGQDVRARKQGHPGHGEGRQHKAIAQHGWAGAHWP